MDQLLERLRVLQANDDSRSEALRMFGGLLLGAGALVLAYRTSQLDNNWAGFPELLVYLLPAVFLLVVGFGARRAIGEGRAWHAVYVVFGLLLVPLTLVQFVDMVGGDTGANLNFVWIFGVTAAIAWYAGMNSIPFGWLAAGLSLLIVWIALWDEVISDGISSDLDTFRVLALIAAAGLIGGGYRLRANHGEIGQARAAEWFTAGGIAFVVGAGLFSLIGAVATQLSPLGTGPLTTGGVPPTSVGGPSVGWDAALGLGSALLIGSGTLFRHRGPVYVGAAGLFLFITLVGLDLDDMSPSGHVLGWPAVLLLLAAGAVFLSVSPQGRNLGRRGTGVATEPAAPTAAMPPPPASPAAPEPPPAPDQPEPPTEPQSPPSG